VRNAFGAAYRDAIDGAEAAMFSETAVILQVLLSLV
jgi:hypothetical protein